MGQINSVFLYKGKETNGATANLWKKAGFPSPPELDDPEPDPIHQEGATITTGVAYGGDGAYRWTGVPDGEYYVSCFYDSHRVWIYAATEIIIDILTTQGDLLVRGTSALERLAKGTDGKVLAMVAGAPAWATQTTFWGIYEQLLNSNDAEKSYTGDVYTKKKETKLNNVFSGDIRIKFDIYTVSEGETAFGRLYKNGVAFGTEQSTTSQAYVTKTEDFDSVNWNLNDLIQVYIKGNVVGAVSYIRNFRFYYAKILTAVGISMTSQDP